jgi:hypothetical protein
MRVWERDFKVATISPFSRNDAVICCLSEESGEFLEAKLGLVEAPILLQHPALQIGVPHRLTARNPKIL